MNVRFLETFIWVARLRSFSAAAERLNLTQASVSNRIATLEGELGVRLFHRDVRTVRLTEEGRRAVERATEIVRLAGEFREAIGTGASLRGTIRIGAADTIAYSWLPELIRRMQIRYPSVSLDLTIDTSLRVGQQIRDGEVDLGFIMGPVIAPGIRSAELCSFVSCWVASTTLELPEGPIGLSDVCAHPILSFSNGSPPHQALLQLLASAGLDGARIYNSTSLSIMARLVASGVGVGALPYVLVRDLVNSGAARLLDVRPPVPTLTFHAVHQDRGDTSLALAITEMAFEIVGESRDRERGIYAEGGTPRP